MNNEIKNARLRMGLTREGLAEISGVDVDFNRVLFSTKLGSEPYYGIACYRKDLRCSQSNTIIDESVFELPVYRFSHKDMVFLGNGKRYYKSVNLGLPLDIVHMKNQLEIVKSIILNRSSWNAFKQIGKSRSEWKTSREFIEQVETSSIVAEIANSCNCSTIEANSLYQEFLGRVDVYIDGKSLDDEVLLAVISKNGDLMNRCKELLKKDWETENASIVENKKSEIEELTQKSDSLKTELGIQQQKLDEVTNRIDEQFAFSESVKDEVDRKIQEAQENAAEFVASMAFFSPGILSYNLPSSTFGDGAVSGTSGYIFGQEADNGSKTVNESYLETIDTVSYELISAGVIDMYARPFAAYLYAAELNHIPLLITGPNASEIVDAYSIGCYGKTSGSLFCTDEFSQSEIDKMIESNDKIVKIINPFNSSWIRKLEEISYIKEIYTFAVYPFSEDLIVEPKSLFSVFIPVYTDLIVDKKPEFDFVGGVKSNNYSEYTRPKIQKRIPSGIKMTPLSRNIVSQILSDMKEMLGEDNSDYDALFALLPYSHATLQINRFLDMINDNGTHKLEISNEVKKQINALYGDEDE